MQDSRKLAFGLSSIFSRSENIAQKGHNADHLHIPQVNMALIFDLDRYRPVFPRPLDGSVRGVKSLRKVLEEVDFNGILMPDWWLNGTKILITADPKVRKALRASTGTQPLLYQITSSHGWSM